MNSEERKMIGFLADKLWDIMVIPELYDRFTDRERDTVNTIRNHFVEFADADGVVTPEGWDKTK